VSALFKGNKVEVIVGEARFVGAHAVRVGEREVTAEKFIVATGSRPIVLPGFEVDGDRVVDSTGALLLARCRSASWRSAVRRSVSSSPTSTPPSAAR
jgi:pyruvate/2-oxoglutarate dehydrogenase complex dihydrolipoamide dehydrogenase (E3) component